MAICFVRASVIGRSGGRSATAAAAYRAGEKIMDEKTRKVHDYTRKQGVDYSEIISPILASAQNSWMYDRSQLWNKVELGEKRVDAQVAREIIIAIPRELDRDRQIDLVREYVQSSYVERGMIADINCHHLDSDNPHAHVMLTMRELKIDKHGVVEFGSKDRSWNHKELLAKQLHEWEVVANKYLEQAGLETSIDARSYDEQGIERIPQIHLGAAVLELMKKGIETSVSIEYDRINLANVEIQSRLEEIYNLDLEISNLATIEAEQGKIVSATRLDIPELLNRLPFITGESTCNIGEYKTEHYTNPSIYHNDKLIASYERVNGQWTMQAAVDDRSILAMEASIYPAIKSKYISGSLTEDFKRQFGRTALGDPAVAQILANTITTIDAATPICDLAHGFNFERDSLADLKAEISQHQAQQQRIQDAAASARFQEDMVRRITGQPITLPDLAQLAISLLEKMEDRAASFDDYEIELVDGDSSRPMIEVSYLDKPLMQMNGRLGYWTSELKNPDRTLDRTESALQDRLKTYNIQMDLLADYQERVIAKIGNVDPSILDNNHVKSTVRKIIIEAIATVDLSTYDSDCTVSFDDENIRALTDIINQQVKLDNNRIIIPMEPDSSGTIVIDMAEALRERELAARSIEREHRGYERGFER